MNKELRMGVFNKEKNKNIFTSRFIFYFLIAFQFLTIIPIKIKGEISEKEIAHSVIFFPIVGLSHGFLILLPCLFLSNSIGLEIKSIFIILILIISNGGFHLDGLADTFDALSIKSTGDKEIDIQKRLLVMKDSTTGAMGVIAIVLVILLKFILIKNLLTNYIYSLFTYAMLLLMPVFSKWSMIPAMFHGKPSRQDGLGRLFINNVKEKELLISTIFNIACFFVISLVLNTQYYLMLLLTILFLIYILSFLATKFFEKKFNGLTGDNLGAISELSEVIFLLITSLILM